MPSSSPLVPWPAYEIKPVSSRLNKLYTQATCIAVDFLNYEIPPGSPGGVEIWARAQAWVVDYFSDPKFCRRRRKQKNSALTRIYPDLLNTSLDPRLRLRRHQDIQGLPVKAGSSPFATAKSDIKVDAVLISESLEDLQLKTTEPFPLYMEPVLASAEEMDEIVDMRKRPPGEKPVMRVSADDLRSSGVLSLLPEFMAQIARSKAPASGDPSSQPARPPTDLVLPAGDDDGDHHQFELDEEQARGRTHVEMEIVAGILEEKAAGAEGQINTQGGGDHDDDDDQDDGFELAIPSVGTAPSATMAGPPMIRPLSSSSSSSGSSLGESESSSDNDERVLPILHRNFDVESAEATRTAVNLSRAGRNSRSRSHCLGVSEPAVLQDSETSSSGSSSEAEEESEDEEGEDGDEDEDEGEQDQEEDGDGMEERAGLSVPRTDSTQPPAGGVDICPNKSRKRACTESPIMDDGLAQSQSDKKRMRRPLIEEVE